MSPHSVFFFRDHYCPEKTGQDQNLGQRINFTQSDFSQIVGKPSGRAELMLILPRIHADLLNRSAQICEKHFGINL